MRFEEGDVVLIVRPFSEIVEGGIEEAVHEGHQPREVEVIKHRKNYESQVDRGIVDHLKDERLELVADIGDRVDLLADVELRHAVFVLFAFPDDDLHGFASHLHVVEH